jgi:hypothetical protein
MLIKSWADKLSYRLMRLPAKFCNWGSPAAIAKQASPSASISAVAIPKHKGTKVRRKRLAIIGELDILDLFVD